MNLAAATLLFVCGPGPENVCQGYETLFTHYQPKVTAYFQPRVHDKEVVDDLAQETFLRVWKGRQNFRYRVVDADRLTPRFHAWLLGISRNVFLEYVHASRKSRSLERRGACLLSSFDTDGQACLEKEEVSAALRCLHPNSAKVLRAEYFPGNLGHRLSPGAGSCNAYHQRLSRARKELREILLRRTRD